MGGSDLDWAVTNRFDGGGGSEVLRSVHLIQMSVSVARSRCRRERCCPGCQRAGAASRPRCSCACCNLKHLLCSRTPRPRGSSLSLVRAPRATDLRRALVRALGRALGRCRVHAHVRMYDGSRRSLAWERRGLVLPRGGSIGGAMTCGWGAPLWCLRSTLDGHNPRVMSYFYRVMSCNGCNDL